MDTSGRKNWFWMMVLIGAMYFLIAISFGELAGRAGSNQTRVLWNRMAFLTSVVAFAIHIAYECFRLGNGARLTALHASIAVGFGALALALAANIHDLGSASGYRPRMLIALVAWPVLTAAPAFVVSLLAAGGLSLLRSRAAQPGLPR